MNAQAVGLGVLLFCEFESLLGWAWGTHSDCAYESGRALCQRHDSK
jgi:hypothetical protein